MIEIKDTGKIGAGLRTGHLYVNDATDEKSYGWYSGQWHCDQPHKALSKGLEEEPCTAFPENIKAWFEQQFPLAHSYLCNLQMLREGNEFTLLVDFDIVTDEDGGITSHLLNPFRLMKLVLNKAQKKGLKIELDNLDLDADDPGYFKTSYTMPAEGTIGQRVNELVELFGSMEQEAMETLLQEVRDLLNGN